MKRTTIITGVTVIAFIILTTGLFAQDLLSVVLHKKGDIIGAKVSNTQGEKLGEISGLVFDKDTGDITYVVISDEGIRENGGRLVPVPFDALRFINDRNAQINISMEKMASAPTIEKGDLSVMNERKWGVDTHKFYGTRP
ncbi:MAG: PRC-barrel domain-containing protein [Nitrospirota bacterium]|nr:PRC-barrel domain-containing protein [Nitrospirota bacterium]